MHCLAHISSTRSGLRKAALKGLLLAAILACAMPAPAQADDHAIVSDVRGNPVFTQSSGTCVRTKWISNEDYCRASLTEVVYHKEVQQKISQDERTVYFPFNVATLTPDAMARLDTLAKDIRSEADVKGSKVSGFADRIGTASYNEALSKKRSENVKNYLAAKGIVNASVGDTKWFGDTMPATTCAKNLSHSSLIDCLQKDRRVEVEIEYAPAEVASR